MKAFYSILVLMFSMIIMESYSQTYLISQGGIVTTCSGTFYDSGGSSGNYSNGEDFTMTFIPATSGAKLSIVFNSFAIESHPNCNKDYLNIYDGVNTAAPLIGEYCGTTVPAPITATNATGALTFLFHSNRSTVLAGWSATISCTVPPNLGLWTGATSSAWNTPSNWYNNQVPASATNVTIPSSASNWPTFAGNLTLGTTCNNITMDGSSELTVTGNLIIAAGTSLTSNAYSIIHVGGNFDKSGTFNTGTSTVDFYGNTTSTVTGSGATWGILTDGFETNSGWTLAGEFQIGSPQGLGGGTGGNNPDPTAAFAGSNVLGVDLTGLGNNPGNYEPNLGDRAYQAISPTYDFSGYANVTLSFRRWLGVQNGNQDKAYIDLSIDNGNTWNIASPIYENPAGATSETSWSLQSYAIPAADNQSQVKIRFSVGVTNQNQQYCGWNIDELQFTGSVGSQATFYNLTVSKANAELISNAHITVLNNAVIKPDAYLTNSSAKALSVGGDFLLEANGSGMASYIDNGTTSVSGMTSVQEYITSERWHLVSSPISDATINTYYDIHLKFYNEPFDTWTYLVLPTTIPMNTCQGYSAWSSNNYNGTTTVSFETISGDLNNSNFYIDTLDYTSSAPLAGFNLLGNPYPSALNWNSSWSMTNLSGWMMIYDNGIYRGYHTDGSSYNGGTPIIPSTQGFWVRALGTGADITIPNSQRVHNGQAFYKDSGHSEFPEVIISAEINGMKDEAKVVFTGEVSYGFDGQFDLEKFENVNDAPTIYTIGDGRDFAINHVPDNFHNVSIPVGFKTGQEGLYQLILETLANLPADVHVYLEDLKEGSIIELYENKTYDFAYSPLDEQHRFNLLFKDSSLGTEEQLANAINIYSHKNIVYINMPEMKTGEIVIYDLMGREIVRTNTNDEIQNSIELNTGTGYYIVKVQTGDQFVTKKIFIK